MKVQVGQYGFLKKQKMQYVLRSVLCIVIGLIIYITGYIVNKGNSKNVCSVLALLMSLPLAKEVTELVVIFPFFDVEKSRYDKVSSLCPQSAELMTGLVVTSEKRAMNLDFLVEYEGNVVILAGRVESQLTYVSEYLTKGIRNWGADYRVKVFGEEKAFLRAIETMKPIGVTKEEQKNVLSYIKSLIVK